MLERLGEQLQLASKHATAVHTEAPLLVAAAFVLTLWLLYGGITNRVHAYQDTFAVTYETLDTNSANFLRL